ncbi:MAG: Glu/Leu/Phe/Val dehydrogenase dimerization domain-containing protein [Gammaproteobacteria bacterium]|nr:Glu/Leu/Phe/Val dehydrogenase dimerization domain-containing protein [Gammaproteobacteria bacterium]
MLEERIREPTMKELHPYIPGHYHHTALDGLFRYAEFLKYGELHVRFDPETGLRAIIAIHSLKRGPAIGGCRLIPYASADAALEDVIRLGYMMSYKAAISGLNHGGAKAVIMRPKVIHDRKAFMESFARFVHELGGRYITAVDSGTTLGDMDIIRGVTPYVTCMTSSAGVSNDPSPWTAHGVRRGIEAAVKFRLNRSSLEGIRVNIQGAGHVGYLLAKELTELGARITMCDVNTQAIERCVDELRVKATAPESIFDVEADVFAPCALGAILNLETIGRLRVSIVAGSANNQLAHQRYGTLLQEHDILYAPDFVINAGGLIYVAAIYDYADVKHATQQVDNIYQTMIEIFERAKSENAATNTVAEQIARERLG